MFKSVISLVWDKLSPAQKSLAKKALAGAALVLATALAAVQFVQSSVQ